MNKKFKILFVEDEPELRNVICELIRAEDYHCDQASNGLDAIEYLNKKKIDLLISDLRMPKMDGADLIFWLRKNDFHIPVIFITGNYELNDKESLALSDCCASLLRKPVSFDDLLRAIEDSKNRDHIFCQKGRISEIQDLKNQDHFIGQHFF